MFTHIVVGSNDIARSKKFYDAIFEAMDIPPSEVHANGRLIYAKHGQRFVVTKPIDGKPATPANGGTIGLEAATTAMADAWHKAGVANGGQAIENPPGIRQTPMGPLYLAYLRDPDGNKLCIGCKVPA
ncbi:VOC family protein [Acetobacter pomorum]|uniref:VOC family protein n=1 Tax=Acetobacter pomorum TaxID=65959 RepID=A0A2G4RCG6_9PROT|nr:VOC family protein [Acetobacter pomorum]KDE20596.1 glyoxalase [Acetobacter aceti 1023]PHY94256.1 VOC family protein [Acetobacter pomorum]GBR48939.1 bleomycin resistance protein [Acetobacter pomorum DSM 11825]